MNTNQKTSHLRINIIIVIGIAIILISLNWIGYRFAMQIKASQVPEQSIQDDSLEQAEPVVNVPDSNEQTSAIPQDSTLISEE